MAKKDFIDNILNFDIDKTSEAIQNKVIKIYLENPDWTMERIEGGSSAVKPLAMWLESQIKYKKILLNINPLRELIKSLAEENQKLEEQ